MSEITKVLIGKCVVCKVKGPVVSGTDEPICPECYIAMSTKLYLNYKESVALVERIRKEIRLDYV